MQSEEFKNEMYDKALEETFLNIDIKLKENNIEEGGSTACVVFVTETKIFCANCGDSRAVLNNSCKPTPLSQDHRPQNPKELQRIMAAGHEVKKDRVDGTLAMSRALGDFAFKEKQDLSP